MFCVPWTREQFLDAAGYGHSLYKDKHFRYCAKKLRSSGETNHETYWLHVNCRKGSQCTARIELDKDHPAIEYHPRRVMYRRSGFSSAVQAKQAAVAALLKLTGHRKVVLGPEIDV